MDISVIIRQKKTKKLHFDQPLLDKCLTYRLSVILIGNFVQNTSFQLKMILGVFYNKDEIFFMNIYHFFMNCKHL